MQSALPRTALRKWQSDDASHHQNFLQLVIKGKCSGIGQCKGLQSNAIKENQNLQLTQWFLTSTPYHASPCQKILTKSHICLVKDLSHVWGFKYKEFIKKKKLTWIIWINRRESNLQWHMMIWEWLCSTCKRKVDKWVVRIIKCITKWDLALCDENETIWVSNNDEFLKLTPYFSLLDRFLALNLAL